MFQIATGVFMFLLGTKLAAAVQADVKYEPSKVEIKEQIDQSPVGSPNFVHQGSNYFFGPPFSRQPGFLPLSPRPEQIDIIEEDIIISKPPYTNPLIKSESQEVIQNSKLSLPLPSLSLNLQPSPYLPSLSVPLVNSQLLSQLPLPSLNIPGLPILKSDALFLSTLIKKPIYPTKDILIEKVNAFDVMPPPPKLPPLRLEEMFKQLFVEEKKIILVPSPTEVEAVYPLPIIMAGQPCLPSTCARSIVFERVLPNIAFEKSKTVELISLPAFKREPVVAASFLPYIMKK